MARIFAAIIFSLLSVSAYGNAKVCNGTEDGKWTALNHIINVWECKIVAEDMGGLTIGVGKIFQAMAGEANFSCKAYDLNGDLIGCYNEETVFAGLGKGVGAGIRLITGVDAESYGLTLVDLEPEKFVGLVKFGVEAEAGFTLGDLGKHGKASISIAAANGWSNFSIEFGDYDQIGVFLGATVNGFALGERGYDGIILKTGQAIVDWISGILAPFKSDGSLNDWDTIPPENFKKDVDAVSKAVKAHPQADKIPGGNWIYAQHLTDNGKEPTQANFIAKGVVNAKNACPQGSTYVTAYAAFACETDQECSVAYFKAVCEEN